MKYFATIDGVTYEISIDGQGQISIDGQTLSVDMQRSGRLDLYSLLIDHASHEVVVEPGVEQRNVYEVFVAGARFEVSVQDERSRRLAQASRNLRAQPGELAIKAPIPGLVANVPVSPGQPVQEGETLVILEAMKMENELRAPRAGVVHEVRVTAGEQVSMGQVLVTLR